MKIALCLTLLAGACTLESGRGFATIESVELHAHFEPGAEREVDGGVLTDLDYVVHLDTVRIELFSLELANVEHAVEPAADDEHTHCHDACEEEAHPEAHPEDEEPKFIASLPVDRSLDLLAGEELFLTEVAPSRELPQTHLKRAELGVGRIELTGSVTAGGLGSEVPLSISIDLDEHLESELDVGISHEGPEQLSLHAELALEGTLFDGIDFSSAESFMLDDEDGRAEALRSALIAALHLHVESEGRP